MKSAKKILLLVLSLMLLVGIFAVAALAEENAGAATVVYPDGTVDTYTAAGAITPSIATQDGLYYGKGYTLYKDAGAGWTYTDADGNAVTEITDALIAKGAKITASGFNKVYYTSEETLNGVTTTVYHLTDDAATYFSSANTGDKGDGTNTGAVSYADFQTDVEGKKTIVKLYSDVTASAISYNYGKNYSSNTYSLRAYFDLNGHTVTLDSGAGSTDGIYLWIYSSVPGAHYTVKAQDGVLITPDDDTSVCLGNNGLSGTYQDNISFHVSTLFGSVYGDGSSVIGGHYYQVPGSTTPLLTISRRLPYLKNATFYSANGVSPLGDPSAHDSTNPAGGSAIITNCKFYSDVAVPIVVGEKNATLKFDGCEFYGIAYNTDSETGEKTLALNAPAGTVTSFVNSTIGDAVSYSTVTWCDGSTSYYYALTLDDAKAFVNSFAIAPHPVLSNDGKTMHYIYNPIPVIEYDADFNAVQTDIGEQTKIYFTITNTSTKEVTYYTTATAHSFLSGAFKMNATMTLYEDVEAAKFNFNSNSSNYRVDLDLNGHNVSVTTRTTASYVKMYVYSSKPGAHWFTTAPNGISFSDTGATVYLGDNGSGAYVDNISFHTAIITTYNWGSGTSVIGGHFYQTAPTVAFMDLTRIIGRVENASFYLYSGTGAVFAADQTFSGSNPSHGAAATGTNPIKNCSFYSPDGNTPVLFATSGATPAFTNCKFYGVNTTTTENSTSGSVTADETNVVDTDAITYKKITFADGTTENYYPADSTAATAFIENHPKVKIINGWAFLRGDDLYYIADPSVTISYDNALNATVSYAGDEIKVAFTYVLNGGAMQYAEDLGTPEANGASFYALLNDQAHVAIVMYEDIVLTSGVRFGTTVDATDAKGKDTQRPYYTGPSKDPKTPGYGEVSWDLNGNTVTIAADATPISMIAWLESQGAQPFNVLHYAGCAKFNLYSSVPGGAYVNNSPYTIFGMNKYASTSYLLGTNDASVDGGDNLTIISNGQITGSYECTENGPAGYNLYVNGGTYVSAANGAVFSIGKIAHIKNAKILATGAAYAMISGNHWSDTTNITLDNVDMIASVKTTKMLSAGQFNASGSNGKKHTITLNNEIAFAGGTLTLTYTNVTLNANGTVLTDTADNLAVAYPTAPEGKTLAYTGISVYGETRAVSGYFTAPEAVTVVNETLNETKTWLVGDGRFYVAGASENALKVDGVWYYYLAPVWEATLGGEAIDMDAICDGANAGKTVTLTVGGERELLYYSYLRNGETTYYYGDTAQAALAGLLSPQDSQRHEIRFFNDIEVTSGQNGAASYQLGRKDYDATILIDLNGYKWTVNSTHSYAFIVTGATSFIYSSVEGGELDVSKATGIACTDGAADAYFGEATKTDSEYGKNLTVYCKSVHSGRWWSNNGYIVGGTYIQPEGITAAHFFGIDDGPATVVRNSTFIVNSLSNGFVSSVKGTFNNCVFIAKEASNLVGISASNNGGATFNNCYFYNVIPNRPEGTNVTYTDCSFNLGSTVEQVGGYIAYTGETVTLTVNGKEYAFTAKLLPAESVTLVNWGFDITEYWQTGATASHANAVVDGMFGYSFNTFVVGVGAPEATLAAIMPGALQMNLSLQSKIGMNLFVNAALSDAIVTFGGETYTLADLTANDNYYAFETAIAPNKATETLVVVIKIGENVHNVNVSVGAYATKILAETKDAEIMKAQSLTYAMVEYVRVMANDASFLADVEAPAGYTAQTLTGADSGNKKDGLLSSIAFQLDGTIAIAVSGTADAEGKEVNLVLATGRSERANITDGIVIFEGLYVNEFFGDMTLTVADDDYTYNYNLANYLKGIGGESAAVQALYNYAYYADAYVNPAQ
ncbi:MAG: hypothetical protein J6K14_01650 [Clostridia bacterium]|nr:hypothetical protein [Clostridia bacterium]